MQLKSVVQWIEHPQGYWVLRNPESITFLQVDDLDRIIIDQLGQMSPEQIVSEYEITLEEIQELLNLLAVTGMLEGTDPPPKKFSLKQILYLKIPLFKPDRWLNKNVHKLRWIWSRGFLILLCVFLIQTIMAWLFYAQGVILTNQEVWHRALTGDFYLFWKLAGFTFLVVFLHELGHAFTLKHYGGIVPEIGLLLICFMPGFYTNTTDQYSLIKRRQRFWVVAAGVIVQIIIWAIAFWFFLFASPGSELKQNSYLLMTASLLTVLLNLNPMNKFDGYYLLVALTGINNLRTRSIEFYKQLWRRQASPELAEDQTTLAIYAPISIIYTVFVLGYFLSFLGLWFGENIPLIFDFYQGYFFQFFQ